MNKAVYIFTISSLLFSCTSYNQQSLQQHIKQPRHTMQQHVQRESKNNMEFEMLIKESIGSKKIVIWERGKYFKDLEIKKYYQLESIENIVLRRVYNYNTGRDDNTIEADFIFKREDEKKIVRRRFVYNNITSYHAVDEGMKIGNYGLNPYLYIKTARLESGHAAWGSFYNFYYGKSAFPPYFQWINTDAAANETIFLILDDTLINAWNVYTGRERNNLRSQMELVDLLTIPPWVKPREMREGEKVALYWDQCVLLETKEENGKYIYVICIEGKMNETLYRRFLLETVRVPRGTLMTREIVYAQYLGNDREGRMRFKEVEN